MQKKYTKASNIIKAAGMIISALFFVVSVISIFYPMPQIKDWRYALIISFFVFVCFVVWHFIDLQNRIKKLEFQKKRDQAEQISAWIETDSGPDGLWVAVNNASKQPVYQVVLRCITLGKGHVPQQKTISAVPPGLGYINVSWNAVGMQRHPGIEIAFSDVEGHHWYRTALGKLCEIEIEPLRYCEVTLPTDWKILSKMLPTSRVGLTND